MEGNTETRNDGGLDRRAGEHIGTDRRQFLQAVGVVGLGTFTGFDVGGDPVVRQQVGETDFHPLVVVKFRDEIDLPYRDNVGDVLVEREIGPWGELESEFPGITINRLYTSLGPQEIEREVQTARRRDEFYSPPNFRSFYAVESPPGTDTGALAEALSSWDAVEFAYVQPRPSDPAVDASDDPRWPNQGYLDPAPDGIDAEFAWEYAGGDGAGLRFVDVERGWTLNHEDLAARGVTMISGFNRPGSFAHGTAVLGEVVGVDNTRGVVGITPNLASARVAGAQRTATTYNLADALLDGVNALGPGDVLLIEQQLTVPSLSPTPLPVEIDPAVFGVVQLATAQGVVVVEAAGNGANNLDTMTDVLGRNVFNRNAAGFTDSGAIYVGAGSSAVPHGRLGFSNFGNRVDCYGWGNNVDTCSSNTGGATTLYTGTFSGTSSASPIVTGAALAVQGIAEANFGSRLAPGPLRALLSNPTFGTPSANPAADRIGVMPDLRRIVLDHFGLPPPTAFADPIEIELAGRVVYRIGPPRDLDGDGLYEDVDGDGTFDGSDVTAFERIVIAQQPGWTIRNPLTPEQVAALDFDGDGDLDIGDTLTLARMS